MLEELGHWNYDATEAVRPILEQVVCRLLHRIQRRDASSCKLESANIGVRQLLISANTSLATKGWLLLHGGGLNRCQGQHMRVLGSEYEISGEGT